jgi:hypothetical protein
MFLADNERILLRIGMRNSYDVNYGTGRCVLGGRGSHSLGIAWKIMGNYWIFAWVRLRFLGRKYFVLGDLAATS